MLISSVTGLTRDVLTGIRKLILKQIICMKIAADVENEISLMCEFRPLHLRLSCAQLQCYAQSVKLIHAVN